MSGNGWTRALRRAAGAALVVTAALAGAAVATPGDVPASGEPPGEQVPRVARTWPVGTLPAVVRDWNPPATPYGPGHRGVDLAAASGAPVRSVAPGRVTFAGRVAGHGVVSVGLAGTGVPALRTTYESVRPTVQRGDRVTAGQIVGVLEAGFGHCPTACLHWGLRRADTYLDPLSLLPPSLLPTGPSRLLPVAGVPEVRERG